MRQGEDGHNSTDMGTGKKWAEFVSPLKNVGKNVFAT
jgi:hypothetical protein